MRPIHYTRRHYHETSGGPTYPGMICDGCGLVAVPIALETADVGSRILAGPVDDRPEELKSSCPIDGGPCGRAHGPP